ncbi:MAG TPA: hypothetical protein VM925_06585 [Labilithrix sp.]|nr:hypothetical protein [Labilithrix sp.]
MRYSFVATLVAGALAIVGWSLHRPSASGSTAHAIAPDPDTTAALPVAPEEPPAGPGIASPRVDDSSPRPRGTPLPLPPTTLRVDTIEPWTGEDLAPQIQLAAAARARLPFDRHDPWIPGRTHPVTAPHDLIFDNGDPWASEATSTGVANAAPPEPSPGDTRL